MSVQFLTGDSERMLRTLPDESVNCCVTSPPYYALRDYGIQEQIGLEETPEKYIERLVNVFREVKRVLRDDGTLWLNIGDSYCGTGSKGDYKDPKFANGRNGQSASLTQKVQGCKSKDLIGIPWMLAFALRNDGWYLRQDIIWAKPNPLPEPVKDRCTKSHEYIFLLSKSAKYYFDHEAMQEDAVSSDKRPSALTRDKAKDYQPKDRTNPEAYRHPIGGIKRKETGDEAFRTSSGNEYVPTGKRNKRDVWTVQSQPCKEAHFAVYPEKLIEPCILAGCPKDGTVLDPFGGSGTTGLVADKLGRNAVLIELNPDYIEIAKKRIGQNVTQLQFDWIDTLLGDEA